MGWVINGINGICETAFGSTCGVCPRYKRKTTCAINTKVGRHAVRGRRSSCIDTGVKRLKVKVTRLSEALLAWVCMSI